MESVKTIKQLSEELGISKTAINNKIEILGLRQYLQKQANQFVLNEQQENLIKSSFPQKRLGNIQEKHPQISLLKQQLQFKNNQIKELNACLAGAHKMITQAQQLHQMDQVLEKQTKDVASYAFKERTLSKVKKRFWK